MSDSYILAIQFNIRRLTLGISFANGFSIILPFISFGVCFNPSRKGIYILGKEY